MTPQQVRKSFHQQGFMRYIKAKLVTVEPGKVIIVCQFRTVLTQHDGYFHGGVMTSLADVACGYAAFTLMKDARSVLTVEHKINFLKAAKKKKLIVVGQVIRNGKTLTICEACVYDETKAYLLAKMQATMIAIPAGK